MEKKIEDLLVGYFSGQLNDMETSELMAWLEEDPAHRAYLYEMSDWWAAAHVPSFCATRETDSRKLFDTIRKTRQRNNQPAIVRRLAKVWKVAAVVFVLFALAITFFYIGRQADSGQGAFYEATVPRGSRSKVVLPDGSVVWLNAASSISYHEDTRLDIRHIRLSGEAFFQVARDLKRPFVVETGEMQIYVKGTQFNVRAYEDQETIDVVLSTGKVDVLSGDAPEARYALLPDEMLSYDRQSHRVETSRVTASEYYVWKDGILKFKDLTFLQLSKELERIYDVPIEIASEHLKQESFSGTFSYTDSIDDILQEIDMEDTYQWTYNGNVLYITDK